MDARPAVLTRTPRRIASALAIALASTSLPVMAWGSQAHRLVAEYAESRLTEQARAEVDRLLALEPGATLASISTWADETRSPPTAAWHYVNFPRDSQCRYDAAQSCVAGNCVVGAIERQAAVLASRAPDEVRLRALKYVVHFVADVHQPLHGGFADDRGGNQFQIQALGRGTNLHALWDTGMIEHWPGGTAALRAAIGAEGDSTAAVASAGQAAEESCAIVASAAFYPDGHKLDAEYAQRWSLTLARRLSRAGQRLAILLNQTLATR